jgi:metal-responsive CopG/Arc/MetJ family transcriptional regulator
MSRVITRNYVLGVRASDEFIDKFDNLCLRLGYNRSEVVRYCLKRFLNEHWNNAENFQKAQKEMF